MTIRTLQQRYKFHMLCQAAHQVFTQWWAIRRMMATATIRRGATAYLVRNKIEARLPDIYTWHYTMTYTDEYEPMPDGIDWYFVRALPRYYRTCTERLAQVYAADVKYRQTHMDDSPHIAKMHALHNLSQWAIVLYWALVATEEEPREITALREKLQITASVYDA